jgi:amino acid transporter
MGATHPRNRTPYKAVVAIGGVTFVLAIALVAGHVSGETIYDWMGSLAVYGFVTVYALVAVALPVFLRQRGRPIAGAVVLAALSVLAMALVLEGTRFPTRRRIGCHIIFYCSWWWLPAGMKRTEGVRARPGLEPCRRPGKKGP